MTSIRHAQYALVLSLTIAATGAFCVVGPSEASAAPGTPVGGKELASAGVIVNLKAGIPPPPAMPGASFLLADMDTGQILVARAPHAPHRPASTMKVLTALTLIPLMNPNATIMVRAQDVGVDGTRLGVLANTAYSVGTLFQGMLIGSGNDASYALAEGNHGMAATLREMNATAGQLGALDTLAKDPSGLDKAGQQTSAYDMALIGRAAMELPLLRHYVSTTQTSLPGGRSANGTPTPGFQISNHNQLLFNYPGDIGIKNGYTKAAGFTYIEAATRQGKTYLLTEMASPQGSWRPAAALLDWAFAHGASLTPIGELAVPGDTPASTLRVVAASRPFTFGLPQSPPRTSPPEFAGQPPWIAFAGGICALALLSAGAGRIVLRKRR
jgi:D-alanyl-D-alanine carboxypeptidase (penicillin-binding protein 5/6)